jgi:hypothetical protein
MPDVPFDMTNEARVYNSKQLELVDFDVSRLLDSNSNKGTTLGFSSDFRPMEQLEPLLGHHPNFEAVRSFITNGMPFVYKRALNDATKDFELQAALDRGNHKSAESEAERVYSSSYPRTSSTVSPFPSPKMQPTRSKVGQHHR